MTRASTPTLLSLDRFARIMGVNPVHFAGAFADNYWPFQGACNEVWPQYSWQSEQLVSREELAREIAVAERDVMRILGYPPAPMWISAENHGWPHAVNAYYLRLDPEFKLNHGKVIAGGQRATSLIERSVIPVFSDADGDGFFETATVTVTTDVTPKEVRVFFAGWEGNPKWEIRPANSRITSGGDVILTFDSWLFIEPELWELPYNISEENAIDISTTGNYVTEVDVYRVYNDTAQESTRYYWKGYTSCPMCGSSGCQACADYSQGGCVVVDNPDLGIVRPMPASYSETDAQWQFSTFCIPGTPTSVRFSYYAGAISDEYNNDWDDEPMPLYLAEAIATLASSRLEKPFCSCGNIQDNINKLRRDLIFGGRSEGFFTVPPNGIVQTNPLGTRRGEVMVWRRLSSMVSDAIWTSEVI